MVGAVLTAIEGLGLIAGIHQILDRAPPCLGAHLEQAERVVVGAVAVVRVVGRFRVHGGVGQHAQCRFGERGHERDLLAVTAHGVDAGAGLDDGGCMGELLPVQAHRPAIRCARLQAVGNVADLRTGEDAL